LAFVVNSKSREYCPARLILIKLAQSKGGHYIAEFNQVTPIALIDSICALCTVVDSKQEYAEDRVLD